MPHSKNLTLIHHFQLTTLIGAAAHGSGRSRKLQNADEERHQKEMAFIRDRLGYLRGFKYSDDGRIPNSHFEGTVNKFTYPVNALVVADALGLSETGIVLAIRRGNVTGVMCDGEWFVDLARTIQLSAYFACEFRIHA